MAKTNIIFNDKNYSIDESSLSAATTELRNHLQTVMNGTGATINFGGTAYGVDSTKLTTATNAFISHLGTISGNGKKIVIGGVEYSIGSDKVAVAIGELEAVLGGLNSGSDSGETYVAGLYQTGAIALYEEQGADAIEGMMIKSWDELLADETVIVDAGAVYTKIDRNTGKNLSSDALDGDLLLPFDGSITKLGNLYYHSDEDWGGYPAFFACKNLTSVIIPNSVIEIGLRAFNECESLTNITIPTGVTTIGEYAFGYCNGLTSIIIPNGVTTIGEGAFIDCMSLTSVTIPTSVTEIGEAVFNCCFSLTSIIIPNGVTTIGEGAFGDCIGLTSVTIPTSVTEIVEYGFGGCENLSSITFEGTIAQWNAVTLGTDWNIAVSATKVVCSDGEVSLV